MPPTKTKADPSLPTTLDAMLATLSEAGARHSSSDQTLLQTIHNHAATLGATCATENATTEAKRAAEAKVFQEANLSHGDIESALRSALSDKYPGGANGSYVWVKEVYDDKVIYRVEPSNGVWEAGTLYQASYSLLDGKVTLGDPTEVYVVTTYQAVAESKQIELAGDLIPLVEAAVSKTGSVALKLISPGWGSSGHYSEAVLKRDGPTAFPKGTKSYWDHPTKADEAARPERSLRDLAAELTSDAHYESAGASGPGLYADAKVFGGFKEAVNELAPHIGVSIRATGTAKKGIADGKFGDVIESITSGKSVDFVTVPGRGGEILQLFEAARGGANPPTPKGKDTDAMDLQEATTALAESERKLTEATAKIAEQAASTARLQEALLLRDARDFATAELAGIEMPNVSRLRIAEMLAQAPVIKDGALDKEAFRAKIKETATTELKYLEVATNRGAIRGMGGAGTVDDSAKNEERLTKAFRDFGLSEASAKGAALGRAG